MEQIATTLGLTQAAAAFGVSPTTFTLIFLIVWAWTLVVKGFALWHAAQLRQPAWFAALLILNTFGILELAYLLFFRKRGAA